MLTVNTKAKGYWSAQKLAVLAETDLGKTFDRVVSVKVVQCSLSRHSSFSTCIGVLSYQEKRQALQNPEERGVGGNCILKI